MRLGATASLSLARTHTLTSRYVVPGAGCAAGQDGHKLLHDKPIGAREASCMLVDSNFQSESTPW